MRLRFQRLHPAARLPEYATTGAAGLDLYAVEAGEVWGVGDRSVIPLGWAVELPEGYGLFVLPRSGLAFKHGLTVTNSPGLVDSDYRGEVQVSVLNHGDQTVKWKAGDRIAQAVVLPVPRIAPEWVEELSETERGTGGFGSTGGVA